jgi:hypothetical protein
LREQAENINAQILIADGEIQQLLSKIFQLEHLGGSNMDEFTEIRGASMIPGSMKNTEKKWFIVTFALCCLLLGTPVIARDLLPKRKDGPEGHAHQLGIPMLVDDAVLAGIDSATSMATTDYDERSRLLALRIQQSIPRTEQGAVVLFSGLEKSADVQLMSKLASCWSRRGERVLLLDTGDDETVQLGLAELLAAGQVTLEHQPKAAISNGEDSSNSTNGSQATNGKSHDPKDESSNLPATQSKAGLPQLAMAGLTNFLKDPTVGWQDLIQQTAVDGVDCVMAGDLPMPAEGLATHRMTDFLKELRQQYSLIVLMGPSTSRPVDLELLASRADGIVFSTDGKDEISERSQAAVKNLVDLNAPVLGVIS